MGRMGSIAAALIGLAAAGCGGGISAESDVRDQVRQDSAQGPFSTILASSSLRLGLDGWTLARPSGAMVQDHDGVWLPLDPDEPGFSGARRVKNLFLWSEDPVRWTLLADGASSWSYGVSDISGDPVKVLRVQHAAGQTGAPYVMQPFSGEPGSRPPGLFASRFELRQVGGTLGLSWTHQGRTGGTAIGSESNSPRTTISLTNGSWQITSQTLQLFEQHSGWVVQAPKTVLNNAAEFEIARMQFEDVSGFKAQQWSSEYVASQGTPGIQWFGTRKATSRACCSVTNPVYGVFNSLNQAISAGGDLTDGAGSPIDPRGLLIEGEATNLASWSGLGQVGVAVLDGASTFYSFVAPAAAGSDVLYLDARSSRLTFRASDIALVQGAPDKIQSTKTDFLNQGWRAGMTIWIHLAENPAGAANGGVQGPFLITAATQHELTLSSSGLLQAKAAGQFTQIHRIPAAGDWIMVQRNNNVPHYARIKGVTLPTIPQTTNPDGYQHVSVRVQISVSLPGDGVHGGASGTNNNQPVYWIADAELSVRASMFTTGVPESAAGKAEPVWDWAALVDAGLGFAGYNGLVWKLSGGSQGNTAFDFAGSNGTIGRDMSASAWVKRVSGTGTPSLVLKSHAGSVRFTNAGFQRIEWRGTNVNGTGTLRVLVPANTVVYAFLPQVIQAPQGGAAVLSSPIITREAPAARRAAIVTMPLSAPISNGRLSFSFVPTIAATSRQTMYWVGDSVTSLEVAISGDKVIAELRNGGEAAISSVPNPGGALRIDVDLGSGQLVLRVNDVAGTPALTGAAAPAGIQYLGSKAGLQPAEGSYRDFTWYLGTGPVASQ